MNNETKKFAVGIDVGQASVGFAAIELDDSGIPIRFLNSSVVLHDSGVDPDAAKTALTRKAVSGVARRARRGRRHRKARLRALESLMEDLGWNPDTVEKVSSEYGEWEARAKLASQYISDEAERKRLLVVAMRHIARHRGWRSPWQRNESLLEVQGNTEAFEDLCFRIEERTGRSVSRAATVGQLVWLLDLSTAVNLRRTAGGKNPTLPLRMMQADHAREVQVIAEKQLLGKQDVRRLILTIFHMDSPRKAASARAGRDPLPGQQGKKRAQRAHPEFQRFRIVSTVMNLRIADGHGSIRPLGEQEAISVIDFLSSWSGKDSPTWVDVANHLGIARHALHGAGMLTDAGELIAGRPPVDTTEAVMRSCSVKAVKRWWANATLDQKCSFIDAQTGEEVDEEEDIYAQSVDEFLAELSDEELTQLDNLKLISGRAAYSVDSLRRLSEFMIANVCDLHTARREIFGVAEDWAPPADPIHAPTGNPAVDRVLKAVNRWLLMVEYRWGTPEYVNIEHVRSGFTSERIAREYQRESDARAKANESVRAELKQLEGKDNARRSDVRRFQALQRQNGACLYCDAPITFVSCEMDHIVPRKGDGSSNVRANLVAVCRECNRAKSNTPFARWATTTTRAGVSVEEAVSRLEFWTKDPGMSDRDFRAFKRDVKVRLTRTDMDPEIDSRSMESVAWMARELAHRIEAHFRDGEGGTSVHVYRGALTAEARRAGGFEKRVEMIGGAGKTRLDRRHHALDAAVIALMRPSVAQTLSIRSELRRSQQDTNAPQTWKEFEGRTIPDRKIFQSWRISMLRLAELCQEALDEDTIGVHRDLRLRLSRGSAHGDTVERLVPKALNESWSVSEIDRASTPAMWCALTRQADFDWKNGLPADQDREVVINGTHYSGSACLDLFASSKAQVLVRGGSVGVGDSIHHVRLYRVAKGKKFTTYILRVFACDLLRSRNCDLFTVELPEQSVSMRQANDKLRAALRSGTAEYLGWIVKNDELRIEVNSPLTGDVKDFVEEFGYVTSWYITGFESNRMINLKPRIISREGIDEGEASKAAKQILISSGGWRVSVSSLFGNHHVTVIRRNALGEERWSTDSGLPCSWQVTD